MAQKNLTLASSIFQDSLPYSPCTDCSDKHQKEGDSTEDEEKEEAEAEAFLNERRFVGRAEEILEPRKKPVYIAQTYFCYLCKSVVETKGSGGEMDITE